MIATSGILQKFYCVRCHNTVQATFWMGRCNTCGSINTMRVEPLVQESVQTEAKPARRPPARPHPPRRTRVDAPDQDRAAQNAIDDRPWIDRVSDKMCGALASLGFLRTKLIASVLTPNSALLRFEGTAKFTVDAVYRRRSELLTTYGLEVITIRPEPGQIVITVARPEREIVTIESVWDRWQPHATAVCNTKLAIGVRESDGSVLFLEPETKHAPHTLIAGSTGSGKSVLMQNILLAIAQTNTPEQARITLIDPKLGVDYFALESLPHIDGGATITTQSVALDKLHMLVNEMERRYRDCFRSARVKDIQAFNAKAAPKDRLPVIWLVHDEFSEWMMQDDYKQSVSNVVSRLGVKARAAGIYLVFAAQRPDANVMPMQLRANLGNRLILRVDSHGTSEIALGESGAENLLGRGHMIAKLDGEPGYQFAQVPYVNVDALDMSRYDRKAS